VRSKSARPEWIIGNPVPHDDPPTGAGHAHHFISHIERLGGEQGAKDANDEVEHLVLQPGQIGRIAFLELEVRETMLPRARFPASTRLRAMSTPRTSAPSFAAGKAVVPSA
jgi:hypothetical protein